LKADGKREGKRGSLTRDAGNRRPIKLSCHETAETVKTILFPSSSILFLPAQLPVTSFRRNK